MIVIKPSSYKCEICGKKLRVYNDIQSVRCHILKKYGDDLEEKPVHMFPLCDKCLEDLDHYISYLHAKS